MIRISCKNERFTYDMYHIVKSFLPDAEISQKVDPEQELLIEMTAEEDPDLEELKSQTSAKKENNSVRSIKNYIRPWSKRPEKNMHGGI